MLSSVERILEGKYNTENHALALSVPMLELSVSENEVCEGSFNISGPSDVFVEGTISATGLRMKTGVEFFSGRDNDISYSFDAAGLSEGEIVKGEIRIISNQGEYLLPYEVRIEANQVNTDLGKIRNLFHFTNLARADWAEAVRLFHSERFEGILGGVDRQYVGIYRGLRNGENKEQNLEEFLLYVKKKQPAEFIIDNPNIKIEDVLGVVEKHIGINRNGWGYSDLRVSCDADFIVLEKDYIHQDDFDGNFYRLSYSVIEERLHEGRNFATVILSNAYNEIRISITVTEHPVNRKVVEIGRSAKHLIVDMMKYYEAFRLRKISTTTWIEETTRIIDKLMELEPENKGFELLHIQILITAERYNEANWRLEQLEGFISDTKDHALYCYYYYLSTLINRTAEYTDEVTRVIEDIFSNHNNEWRLGWLLLYLSEESARSPLYRWERLSKQYKSGATSPVIYVEAYQILNNNPTVLTSLGSFEKQILKYSARKQVLTPEIVEQFIYLLGQNKNYDSSLLPLLTECYNTSPSDDVLKAIVSLLINTDRHDKVAHKWYTKAIERTLRITKLYEYYMLSLDMDEAEEIPKLVLMYFAFDSALDAEHNAYLYAYVYKNKELYPDLFENYKDAIERFVSFEILKGHNNRNLTYLYRNMITETMITPDIAEGLKEALFTCMVRPVRESVNSVILYYDDLNLSYEYRLNRDGRVYIPIYGANYHLILVDKNENKYAREEEFELVRFMVPDKLASHLKDVVSDILFDMWRCKEGRDLHSVSEDNCDAMRRIADNEHVTESLRQTIKSRLIDYYYNHDMMEELDDIISGLNIEDVSNKSISSIIQFMTQRGMYDKAYEWLSYTGGDEIDAKTIVRLCSRIMRDDGGRCYPADDKVMLSLIYRAFEKGKYDELLLGYMVQYIECTSKEMRDIWRVATEYGIDTKPLEKRFITQLLYSNAFVPGTVPIFLSYSQKRADRKTCIAFLSQVCFDYFVNEKVLESEYVNELQSYIDEDEDIPFVCKLAYTRYYSKDAENLNEKISRTIVIYLKQILSKGMYFAYFKDYARSVTYMHRFMDKTIIEYRVPIGSKASIHYMTEKNSDEEGEYIKEDMKDMYHGICVKQFVLFFGERLQYYIVEQDSDGEHLTESSTVTANEMDSHENLSRYTMINDIAISRTLGDYDTMDGLLTEYFKDEYLIDQLFKLC